MLSAPSRQLLDSIMVYDVWSSYLYPEEKQSNRSLHRSVEAPSSRYLIEAARASIISCRAVPEDDDGKARGLLLQQQHQKNASPPMAARRAVWRPIPQRPPLLGTTVSDQHEASEGYAGANEDSVSCYSSDLGSVSASLEELRLEGARNPFRDEGNNNNGDDEVLLSESTRHFLRKQQQHTASSAASAVVILKPVAMRATDLVRTLRAS